MNESAGETRDVISVRHPDGEGVGKSFEQESLLYDGQCCGAVLLPIRALHFSAEDMRHELHSIADAEDGNIEGKNVFCNARSATHKDGIRSAGKNDASCVPHVRDWVCVRNKLCRNAKFPDATGDELRILRPEIKNKNDFATDVRNVSRHRGAGERRR